MLRYSLLRASLWAVIATFIVSLTPIIVWAAERP
jgi:hypothetical protein